MENIEKTARHLMQSKLLSIGGKKVVMPPIDEYVFQFLAKGMVFDCKEVITSKGADSQCHFNTSRLWQANRKSVKICTGYALSDDGIWREHSWGLWAKKKQVVETTVPRIAYFGIVLDKSQAEDFFEDNGY